MGLKDMSQPEEKLTCVSWILLQGYPRKKLLFSECCLAQESTTIHFSGKKKILSHELAKVEAGRQITGVVQVIDDCGEKSRDGEKWKAQDKLWRKNSEDLKKV